AEDGIRDLIVTGVQTCALPISIPGRASHPRQGLVEEEGGDQRLATPDREPGSTLGRRIELQLDRLACRQVGGIGAREPLLTVERSEERRVGIAWTIARHAEGEA